MQLFDAHCHVQDKQFDGDREDVLARMRESGMGAIVVGTDAAMSKSAVALAQVHDTLWATVGVHPTDNHTEIFDEALYTELASHKKVVAIGECGLDYYWPNHDAWPHGEVGEKKRQSELFEQQILLSKKVGKPLMVHGRPTKGTQDAYEDILALLEKHKDVVGDVHFFVGSKEIAKRFLDLGFYLSFTGVLTFTHDYDEVVATVPMERILTETDAPYVAPVPHRGKRNEPQYVAEVVRAVARIKGISQEEVAAQVLKNVHRLFRLA